MNQAEPKTVLYFLWNYYDTLYDLYQEQKISGYISRERMQQVCDQHGTSIQSQLLEYRIVRQVNQDMEFHSVYYSLFEYLLNEFKPLLPETIQKYYFSISSLFRKIREGQRDDRNILSNRVADLSMQIKEFGELVEKNTIRLLAETRELKSNVQKIDYREKVHKASFWIEYYILPLNQILDVNHPDSIANRLYDVSEFANQKRLNFHDEGIRVQFSTLYNQLLQCNDDLLRQSRILTNELLPLIERIKTESTILTGFMEFLKQPYKTPTPPLLKSERDLAYSKSIYLNTREFFEQFLHVESMVVEEPQVPSIKWIFDKEHYKTRLSQSLPVESFFGWAAETLKGEYEHIETDKFFSLAGLLFEEDLHLEFDTTKAHERIRTDELNLRVPKIKINTHGVSEIPYADR
jgi:hypothetical protein